MSYLSFSKKERMGIVVLMTLILAIWLLPKFFGRPETITLELKPDADSFVTKRRAAAEDSIIRSIRLFYFDPNLISDAEWEELGINRRTVSTIRNYLSKGGRFRGPEDIRRIYGLKKDQAERLMPYVRIANMDKKIRSYYPQRTLKREQEFDRALSVQNYSRRTYQKTRMIFDINTADSLELESLPGIGTKLASRIIRFRDALGGFHSIEQISDVYGIDDSLFNLISSSLTISSGIYRKIRINHWDADSLDSHPYIQRHEARAIVKYRTQHGHFNAAEELGKINLFSGDQIGRLMPYVDLD